MRVQKELAANAQSVDREIESDLEQLRRANKSHHKSAAWSDFVAMWRRIGMMQALTYPLEQLPDDDAEKVVRSALVSSEADVRAAKILTEEYARGELARLAPSITWLIQVLVQTAEDRELLMSLMRFLDRHRVTALVDSWDAPEELLSYHRGARGHKLLHVLAPKVTDASARERVYERLRTEGIVTSLERVSRPPHAVVAAAMDESPGAHRERVSQRRRRK